MRPFSDKKCERRDIYTEVKRGQEKAPIFLG